MFAFFLVARQYLFEWADLFVFDSDTKLDDLPSIKTNYALWYFLKVSLFFGTPVFLITVGTQLAVGGINFAPKAMLSLIHISEPTRRYAISYSVLCL